MDHTGERTLLSHEWLAKHGGSENVFEVLCETFPLATAYCLWDDSAGRFDGVRETWLSQTPLRRSKAASLPLQPAAWQSVPLHGVERVITSSHAFGHHLAARAARKGIASFAYIHTPARYVWSPELDPRGSGLAARALSVVLRPWDRATASPLVSYASNSNYVRQRIEKYWGVSAKTIYPPVSVRRIQQVMDWKEELTPAEQIALSELPGEFILGASRLVTYKRLDMAISVGAALDMPVVIAGDGPDRQRLESLAADTDVPVRFIGKVSDPMLYALYERASLFVFMAIEDFGIMPVECMALGTPVLGPTVGGVAESIAEVHGGITVDDERDLAGVRSAARAAIALDSDAMVMRARNFDTEAFREKVTDWTRLDK